MADQPRTLTGRLSRGGDIWRNRLNIGLANVGYVATAGALAFSTTSVAVAAALAGKGWPLYWRFNVARVLDTVPGLGNNRLLSIAGQLPSDFVTEFSAAYHRSFWFTTGLLALVAGGAAAYFAATYLAKKFLETSDAFKDKFVRGIQLISKDELNAAVAEENQAYEARLAKDATERGEPAPQLPAPYRFCGVVVPHGKAQRNFLATGAMGSGKSVAIFDVCDQVAERGKSMVFFDNVTEFAEIYYRGPEKDVIWCPFDQRSLGWNIFHEITTIYGFADMAAQLIPMDESQASEAGKFFVVSARTVFADGLRKLREQGKTTTEDAVKLFNSSPDELADFLKGTAGGALISPESKSRGDIISTLISAIEVLRYVKSGDFSLRKFIEEGGDRRLFLTAKEETLDALKPLLRMALTILYKASMNRPKSNDDVCWYILDEIATIEKLPILAAAVTKARKFGVVTLLGAQSTAQLKMMFGKDAATVVQSNLGNYVVLRVAEPETAEDYSKLIGSGEYDEQSEGVSWGPVDSKDGASINISRKDRKAVHPGEIMSLPDREGFLKLAGHMMPCRVSYDYKHRPTPAQGFLPRDDLDLNRLDQLRKEAEARIARPAEAAAPATTSATPAAKKRSVF